LPKVDKSSKLLNTVGLHYYTSLLEAVEWDEESLDSLIMFVSEYLEKKIEEKDLKASDITDLLDQVESSWGYSAKENVKGLINFEAFNLNLLNTRSEDVN
tara:strand:- start:339 stop:638 length:300 start_codon:yes stop_codon:yes gene_type:complete